MTSSRRNFVIGAGCATAALTLALPRAKAARGAVPLIESDPDLRRLIERERESILAAMAKEDIPGAAICLIHDGKPAWIEGFGVTDRNSKRPVGPDTIFSIQSTSKNLTTTAILLAAQRGLLDLDRPITSYLRDFKVNSCFEPRPQDKMTLRDLLGNRAGFTHEAPIGNNGDPSFPSFEAHVQSISQTWLRFPVGERYRYSNLGFDLAGYILQTAMRKPFAECLRTLLFAPLDMKDTTADTDEYSQRQNRALGHVAGFETVPLRIPLIPSGGVYASARDLASYLMFHINQGKAGKHALLDQARWNEMHSFSRPGAYSLGVAGGKLRFGETDLQMLTHSGGGFGFGSVFCFYPQAKLGLAVLFNRASGAAYQWGSSLTNEILTRQYGKQTPRIRLEDFPPRDVPEHELRKFVGHWIGRQTSLDLRLDNGILRAKRGELDVPLRIASPVDITILANGSTSDATSMVYFPPANGTTAHLECTLGDADLDYNDGPNDPPGPNKKEWDDHVGSYRMLFWGKPSYEVKIHRKNGYLYLNEIRLVREFERGLFFTSDGEAVDFRHDIPTWGNARLNRSSA